MSALKAPPPSTLRKATHPRAAQQLQFGTSTPAAAGTTTFRQPPAPQSAALAAAAAGLIRRPAIGSAMPLGPATLSYGATSSYQPDAAGYGTLSFGVTAAAEQPSGEKPALALGYC